MYVNSKQKTLLESWKFSSNNGSSSDKTSNKTDAESKEILKSSVQNACINLCDDIDDADLLDATVAVEHAKSGSFQLSTNLGDKESLNGFDKFSGDIWIYPTNYSLREYQYAIVKTALFKNTLVALPTGLGKTFIAAVVLYNYYRWYPRGKVVFMAPTKPLVSQQIDACYKIMGIPMSDQAQLTGANMASHKRSELWSSKRVFFVTPQVINNDLAKGVCPASAIKCLVIDEAHKALGNHAYCQVIQQLLCHNRNFRVLALSATPGSDLKTVQQVIKNLLISQIEIRSEDAIDIKQYVHTRSVDKVVVKLTEQILSLRERYFKVIQMFISSLVNNKALYNKDVRYLTKYALLMARDQFRKDPPSGLSRNLIGTLEGAFAISISLYHGLELLLQHGMKTFFIFLKGIMDGPKNNARSKTMLYSNEDFRSIYDQLIAHYGSNPDSVVLCTQAGGTQQAIQKPTSKRESSDSYIYSHPKMKKLEEVVLQHFQNIEGSSSTAPNTRVMIFCQFRDIVREITELLQQHRPLVRPMQFVGHAVSTNPNEEEKSSGKTNRRFTQKDQLMVVSKFRSGDYNTLVSTCVGEEGLDIGDVDLIICYDSHKSPIRLVQRMGRTGRKRKGRIVMLVTEGKEERDYNSSLASRKSIHKAIIGAGKSLQYYPHSPRMVPACCKPKCHKMFLTIPEQSTSESCAKKSKPNEKKSTSVSVATMLKKSAASSTLNADQKESWKKNLMLSEEEKKYLKVPLPKNKTGKSVYLEKEALKSSHSKTNSNYLSLNEWLPWQSRLQFTKFVDHSSRSKMLTEMIQFCDDIREHGATQCGYKHDNNHEPRNFFHDQQSTSKTNNKVKNKKKLIETAEPKRVVTKKKRKPLIVLSDDDENFLADDFQELPIFDPKTSSAVIEPKLLEVDTTKNVNDEMLNESLTETVKNEDEIPAVPCQGSTLLSDTNVKEDSKDSYGSLFSDLPSLSPSSVSSDENIESSKPIKMSKSIYDPCIIRPRNPSSVSAISLDFLKDDVSSVCDSQSETPLCFKIWGEEDDEEKDQSNRCNSNNSIPTEIPSLFVDTHDQKMDRVSQQFEAVSQNPEAKIESCSHLSATDQVPGLTQKDAAPCLHPSESNPTNVMSFDGSADMFAPQFELDFDLDFSDFETIPEERSPATSKEFVSKSENPLPNNTSKSTTSSSDSSNKKEIVADKVTSKLSPASMTSFSLSQTKRIQNQKLFADLNSLGTHTPPCAKVKPQTLSSTTGSSGLVIVNSPHQSLKLRLKSLKRSKQSREKTKVCDWSDADDDVFQLAESPIKKRKKDFTENISENERINSSPFLPEEIAFVFDDDEEEEEANFDLPFQDSSKKKNKKLDNLFINDESSFLPSSSFAKTPNSKLTSSRVTKQSTPKPPSVSNPSQSDDSLIVKRKTRPNHKKKRELNHARPFMFICDEAEVSADGAVISSDEDENDSDMNSFVNDASQLTQLATQGKVPDERALYLRSLDNKNTPHRADTATLGGKFKLAYGVGHDIDVFSQEPEPDVSDYVNDSFCVDNNTSDVTDLGDVTLLESDCFTPDKIGTKTRAQRQLEKHFPVKPKLRNRIVVFDDEDPDATQLSDPPPSSYTPLNREDNQLHSNPTSSLCNSSTRYCELCGGILLTKGWMCKDCVAVMKRSEIDQSSSRDTFLNMTEDKNPATTSSVKPKSNPDTTLQSLPLSLNKEERLRRSKLRQEELRAKLKIKRSSFESNQNNSLKNTSGSSASSNLLDGNKIITATSSKQGVLLNEKSLIFSSPRPTPSSIMSRKTRTTNVVNDHLTIFIDNKELSSGAAQIAQLLRTTHKSDVHVVSLQCSSYVVSCRCVVWRRTVDDVSNTIKRQKLFQQIQHTRMYYKKLYVIVEKDKVKKGWANVKPAQASNMTVGYLALTQAGIKLLHSDDQIQTAQLLHKLAVRESTSGNSISRAVSCHVTNQRIQPLLNIYLSFPGVAYTHALYLCHHFRSLKELLKRMISYLFKILVRALQLLPPLYSTGIQLNTVDQLITEVRLSPEAAKNLFYFLRKKFDIQMTPL